MSIARPLAATILRRNLCTQCRGHLTVRTLISSVERPQSISSRKIRPTSVPSRWHSMPASRSKVYDFAEIQKMSESASPERVLIDVREPSEYSAGYIPSAINLPIKSQPDAIFLPEEEFEDRFGFEKPSTDKEVIFYCRSGVRSSAAAQLAQQHGYTNVAEYRGSWLDWEKNGGSSGKP